MPAKYSWTANVLKEDWCFASFCCDLLSSLIFYLKNPGIWFCDQTNRFSGRSTGKAKCQPTLAE